MKMKSEEGKGKNDFIEQRIIEGVQDLLTTRVNELLGEFQFAIPSIEFGDYRGSSVVAPVISLSECERTEKERIIKQDAYTLTITIAHSETLESELYCFAYAGTISRAIYDYPTLGGIVDRVLITGKEYKPPKKPGRGDDWELVISLRITVEGMGYGG